MNMPKHFKNLAEDLQAQIDATPQEVLNPSRKVTLGQADALYQILKDEKEVQEKYATDFDTVWPILTKITEKQKKYILHCVYSKKYHKLTELLDGIKIPRR